MASGKGRLASLSVGVRLKLARDKRGLTMARLGELADVGSTTIDSIEKGKKQPRGDTVERLARALGVSACWLHYDQGEKPVWES